MSLLVRDNENSDSSAFLTNSYVHSGQRCLEFSLYISLIRDIPELPEREEGEGEESELQNAAYSSWSQPRRYGLFLCSAHSVSLCVSGGREKRRCGLKHWPRACYLWHLTLH